MFDNNSAANNIKITIQVQGHSFLKTTISRFHFPFFTLFLSKFESFCFEEKDTFHNILQ